MFDVGNVALKNYRIKSQTPIPNNTDQIKVLFSIYSRIRYYSKSSKYPFSSNGDDIHPFRVGDDELLVNDPYSHMHHQLIRAFLYILFLSEYVRTLTVVFYYEVVRVRAHPHPL